MGRVEPAENPLENISCAIAFSPKDWSVESRDAWIYGIVLGWDDESLDELSKKHGWGLGDVERLKRLCLRFKELNELAKLERGGVK